MDECRVEESAPSYPLEITGLWGEAVRQRRAILVNDYAAPNPGKKGCPEGHVALARFLTVPIFNGESVAAVIGVANKIRSVR